MHMSSDHIWPHEGIGARMCTSSPADSNRDNFPLVKVHDLPGHTSCSCVPQSQVAIKVACQQHLHATAHMDHVFLMPMNAEPRKAPLAPQFTNTSPQLHVGTVHWYSHAYLAQMVAFVQI